MMPTTCTAVTDVEWPEFEPIAAERLVAGEPSASTLVTARYATSEVGLWQVTEGVFTTDHTGYLEFMHIVDGEGELVHEDGTVLPLFPGVTITMGEGWRGRWVVRRRLTKSYAIVHPQA